MDVLVRRDLEMRRDIKTMEDRLADIRRLLDEIADKG